MDEFITKDVELALWFGKGNKQLAGLGLGEIESMNKVAVKWHFELEYREWGIKGYYTSVPEQEIWVSGMHYPNPEGYNDDELVDFDLLIVIGTDTHSVKDYDAKIVVKEITSSLEFKGEALCPSELTLEWNGTEWKGRLE